MLADSGLHWDKAQACVKHRVTVGESQYYASIQHRNSSEFLTAMRLKLLILSLLLPVLRLLEHEPFLAKLLLEKLYISFTGDYARCYIGWRIQDRFQRSTESTNFRRRGAAAFAAIRSTLGIMHSITLGKCFARLAALERVGGW